MERLSDTSRGLRILTGAIKWQTSLRLSCGNKVLELADWVEIVLAPSGRISNCLMEQAGNVLGQMLVGQQGRGLSEREPLAHPETDNQRNQRPGQTCHVIPSAW